MYWTFRWRVCPGGFPYFDPPSLLCYDVCPDGTYPDTTAQMCRPCLYSCRTCSSYSVCTDCDPITNRYLNGTSCLPNPGYYDNLTANATVCSSLISGCTLCDNLTCFACSSGEVFDSGSGTCLTCSVQITNCINCSMPSGTVVCDICDTNYTQASANTQCILNPCTVANCTSCPTDTAVCQGCATGFSVVGGLCQVVCGDGQIAASQQCDDNNTIDGDGCNADCTIGNNNSCPASSPYIDPVSTLCTSSCPNGYLNDPVNFACQSCFYTCYTCSNTSTCDSCIASSNRQMNGSDCLPMDGFYDNGTINALRCQSPCLTCNSPSNCITCETGYYLSGTTCLPCSNSVSNCTQCFTNGSCTACALGFIINNSTGFCDVIPCTQTICLVCPVSISICTQCTTGYQPSSSGVCVQYCGDFLKIGNQQCDDGNRNVKDGCSDSCTIQPDFTCQPDPNNSSGSACYFLGNVTVDLVYMNKVDGENKIQILLDLSPNDLPIWDSVNFLDMIQMQSPVPVSGVQIIRNSDGTVSITFSYAADIQGQSINITVDPANTGQRSLQRVTPTNNLVVIDPDDNEGAYFYDQSTYKMANIISLLGTAIGILSLVFFFIGLVSGKMVGVQMMAVVQISFFSLVSLTQMNPCFAALSSLKFANGYNKISDKSILQDEYSPNQPKGIFLFSRFTQNFNITAALIFIPLLIALISFILLKTAFKNNERVQKIFRRSIGQYTLMMLLFGGYMIAVSFGLQIMYGMKNNEDFIGKVSLAQCALLLGLIVAYFVFLLVKPEFFGEYTQQFKKDKLSQKYYNFMLIERFLLGSLLIFMLSVKMQVVVPIAIFVLTLIFVAVKNPYIQKYHNYRVIANMSISSVVLAIYLVFKMSSQQAKSASPIYIYLPIIVCALLLVCVIYNSAAIIYQLYKLIKNRNIDEQLAQEQLNQMKKLRDETTFGNPGSPNALKSSLSIPVPKAETSNNPIDLRKQIKLDNIKKQLTKLNPKTNEIGLANTILLQKDEAIDSTFLCNYDAI